MASQAHNQRPTPQEVLEDIQETTIEDTLQDPVLQPGSLTDPAPLSEPTPLT